MALSAINARITANPTIQEWLRMARHITPTLLTLVSGVSGVWKKMRLRKTATKMVWNILILPSVRWRVFTTLLRHITAFSWASTDTRLEPTDPLIASASSRELTLDTLETSVW